MYENSGKKLMGVVKRMIQFMMVLSILSGLVVWVILVGELHFVAFLAGAVVAVVGCVMAWLSNLVLATFAEMAMDIREIREGNVSDKPMKEQGNLASAQIKSKEWWTCAACGQKNLVGHCQSCGVTKAWSEEEMKKRTIESNADACPKCGKALNKSAMFCTDCGTKLGD